MTGGTNSSPEHLETFDGENGDLNVIIETPKGSRNKYKWNEKYGRFSLDGVLPAGSVFPFDFGFVPSTLGDDGDPLDVLLLLDEPVFAGCLLAARLIGVITAEQTERDGQTMRNDRLLAVACKSHNNSHIESLDQLSDNLITEIEHFFIAYNEVRGKQFKPIGRGGPDAARKVLDSGMAQAQK